MLLLAGGSLPTTRCSQLTCDGSFNFPLEFNNSTVELDLGRDVLLNYIDVVVIPTTPTTSYENCSISLSISKANDPNSTTSCWNIYAIKSPYKFFCSSSLGRYMTVVFISGDSGTV